MSEMMIWTIFAIGNMMRITGVVISKKSKGAEQTAISKSFKTLWILYTLCVPCRKWWFKHHWSSNFEKVKICKGNSKFEKFENTASLIYTMCPMSEMQRKLQIRKVWKHCKSYIHYVPHVGNDDLNYICHS